MLSALGIQVWSACCTLQIAAAHPQLKSNHVASLAASLSTGEVVTGIAERMGLGPHLIFQRAPGQARPYDKMLKVSR